jgi:dihydroflavonol-4-reductase
MYLVTGATGLVGSHLIRHLVHSGKKVRALRRPGSDLSVFATYLHEPGLRGQVEWIDGDVLDVYSLADAMEGVEKVYHTAAVVSFRRSQAGQMMKVNAEGTANVVNAALEQGIRKLCHVSSVAALGRTERNEVITENSKWITSRHNSVYAITKYNAEREVWRGIAEGLEAVIVNPSIILGPADWNRSSTKLFGTIHRGLRYYTEGVNAFVDVRDVVAVMDRLMESSIGGERFIVMSENLCYRDVFNEIALQLGKKPPSVRVSPFIAEVAWRAEWLRSLFNRRDPVVTRETARTSQQIHCYSNEKIRQALDYTFIPVKQSIHDTCRAFLAGAAR